MIHIAGDHQAEPALQRIRAFLDRSGRRFREYGYNSGADPGAKLQDFIPLVAEAVRATDNNTGILICGTGAGVEIGANRYAGVRASLCGTPQAAEWARTYDDANVLCLASWALPDLHLEGILTTWYETSYDGDTSRREMFKAFDSWSGAR
jgi:ribose 5-phosphate isomerase B